MAFYEGFVRVCRLELDDDANPEIVCSLGIIRMSIKALFLRQISTTLISISLLLAIYC